MKIVELQLQTAQLAALKTFYTSRLGLPLVVASAASFTLGAGHSRLTFSGAEGASAPFYHVAFNIPHNQFGEAKAWLAARVDLLPINGEDELFFEDWNAHAVYFHDPAGNIMELIARHNLPNHSAKRFDTGSLLRISEIGLPVPQVPAALAQLRADLHLARWRGNDTDFAAVGDEEGLFIVVSQDRGWLPTGRAAQIDPLRIQIQGVRSQTVRIAGTPYEIVETMPQPVQGSTANS